ncbi:LysR substrate-binding domain-containing protein [Chitinimonas sp. BJYL2]|uniref:LysR substrate-binding domain-containing protein n=1 Tax=Chitinimonas sp. BJYL2 TaxID=2976696 RepID=UPI0022B4F36F|nr:LysR substrate-binding domain-containing protein [Chitinimonas sp. BJYL2]
MQDLNDLHYFARVVEAGGFAAAGRLLGMPKSTLSRRVAELEARLGVRLLHRTTRKLVLTEVGERFHQHCLAMLLEADAAEEAVAALSAEPRGRLRVSCPVSLAQTQLTSVVPGFLALYPKVRLEVLLTNRRVDVIEEGVDIALRVRAPGDEDASLVARRLRRAESILVAHPHLLAGRVLDTPEQLAELPSLGALDMDRRTRWPLQGPNGHRVEVVTEPRLGADDFILRKAGALAALGVTMLPEVYCEEELAAGTLVRVLPGWHMPEAWLQAVYAHRRGLLPAVRCFVDYLVEVFGKDADRLV